MLHELILNSVINYVPVSNWTMAKQGSKKVNIAGVDDKWQISGWKSYWRAVTFAVGLPPSSVYLKLSSQ